MAQNFLYMFEFVIDDLLITRPNRCAPEEYPTCVEITFRSSVFVSICDREYGHCVDICAPKCGKCCLFSLESPITEKDRLMIHVYKRKNVNCKFLLGATDMNVKPLFEKVTDNFDIENPQWMEKVTRHNACMPDPKHALKRGEAAPKLPEFCCDDFEGRKEQFCPTSELNKGLLPLFNMKGEQTGNLMLITRLVCNGPAIVSSFPFARFCKSDCGVCTPKSRPCDAMASTNSNLSSNTCTTDSEPCKMPDPCSKKPEVKPMCHRYFACNDDTGCPCEECEDYRDRPCNLSVKPVSKANRKSKASCCPDQRTSLLNRQCGGTNGNPRGKCYSKGGYGFDDCCLEGCEAEGPCDDDESCFSNCVCVKPCFMQPSHPVVFAPESSYEEFVACLNGSGVTIRVFKGTHNVVRAPCERNQTNEYYCTPYERKDTVKKSMEKLTKNKAFLPKKMPKASGSAPNMPDRHTKKKNSGQKTVRVQKSKSVPLTKIKKRCNSPVNKLDNQREQIGDSSENTTLPTTEEDGTRSFALQVDAEEINSLLDGINLNARKKGIEVCYKTCDDPDSEVFLVRLGSKKSYERKRRSVEIELKTPKIPIFLCPVTKCTTETQIHEGELDATMSAICKLGKKKSKKRKRAKKSKK